MSTATRDRIFISYRRTDAWNDAGRLKDALVTEFGADRVFHDVDMPPGTPFPKELSDELSRAAVLLVVIAEGWLAAADKHHRRRIDQSDDWVRHEIITGLAAGIQVIPVLIGNATLPPTDALPTDVAPLADCQWHQLGIDTWRNDLVPLVDAIADHAGWSRVNAPSLANAPHAGRPGSERLFGSRPPIVRDFIERDQMALLHGPGAQVVSALHGIGGVGKSQLAAKHFQDHQAEYDLAAWVDMRDRDGLTDYGSIATSFDLDVSNDDIAKAVRNTIEGTTADTWLLVFDNA
ncbi:MAG: TIR domain-containing protein, partial [bacterium]|nr:TIR domain-containing protein [bacterium]